MLTHSCFCSVLTEDPQGDAQHSKLSAFLFVHIVAQHYSVTHAVVVMSLRSLIYSIAHGQWLITITRALIDFCTTCWWLLLFIAHLSPHLISSKCLSWVWALETGMNPRLGVWTEGRAAGGKGTHGDSLGQLAGKLRLT